MNPLHVALVRSGMRRFGGANVTTITVVALAALGVVQFYRPPAGLARGPLTRSMIAAPLAMPSSDAFGASGAVRLRIALPGEPIEYPLEVSGDPSLLRYQWVPLGDTIPADAPHPLSGATTIAPGAPGFYRLALISGNKRRVLNGPTIAVMVPFTWKAGALLNGYRIGTYLAERLSGIHDHPDGFVEVHEEELDLQVSEHFRLADFVTHDAQGDVWPKYVALDTRLLDKLELVLAKIGEEMGEPGAPDLAPDVHSGFRTPAHNAAVRRAARDSRHQYGDAADVAIDADGDGRITPLDEVLVSRAVDEVEAEHPELAGGLGLYTSEQYHTPYVHIDTRGHRSRWRG